MLNDRQKILLELCCACISSGKFPLKDLWYSIDSERSYLEMIANYIQDEGDEEEECLDKEDNKPIIQEKSISNYSY